MYLDSKDILNKLKNVFKTFVIKNNMLENYYITIEYRNIDITLTFDYRLGIIRTNLDKPRIKSKIENGFVGIALENLKEDIDNYIDNFEPIKIPNRYILSVYFNNVDYYLGEEEQWVKTIAEARVFKNYEQAEHKKAEIEAIAGVDRPVVEIIKI